MDGTIEVGARVAVEDPSLECLSSNEGTVAEVRDDGTVLVALDAHGKGAFPFPAGCLRWLSAPPTAPAAITEKAEPRAVLWAGEDVIYHHPNGDRPAMILRFDGLSRADLVLDFERMQFEGKERIDLAIAAGAVVQRAPEGPATGCWSRAT
ncbi:MAG TPA: hypothetical protein VEG38_04915 [Acidimicrobiia bacterium]|nr:hypothetical protein [Acidimicrobiia bacterium]